MRKFGLCLFYGLCVFTIAFSLFWMALPRLPLPEAPADETPPISGSVSSLVQAAAPTAAGYYLCDTGGRVAVYACNADGTPGALQQLTGIYVNLLPENDVLRIRRGMPIVGFENHGGRTTIGNNKPLGKVLSGYGNDGQSGEEGVVYKNVIGTYLHGPLLPKNPQLADLLISRALEKKYGKKIELEKLDDSEEQEANSYIFHRFVKNEG